MIFNKSFLTLTELQIMIRQYIYKAQRLNLIGLLQMKDRIQAKEDFFKLAYILFS